MESNSSRFVPVRVRPDRSNQFRLLPSARFATRSNTPRTSREHTLSPVESSQFTTEFPPLWTMFSGPDSLYQSVLQTELLGSATQLPAPGGSSANLPISLSLSVHPKHPPAPTILRFEPSRIYHRTSPQDRSRQAAAQLAPGLALAGFLTIESQVLLRSRAGFNWSMPVTPIKVLDAPGLTRQVVRSVLDWSSIGTLAVGLPDDVYTLPNAAAQSPGTVAKLPDPHGVQDPVAVRWCPNVRFVAQLVTADCVLTLGCCRALYSHAPTMPGSKSSTARPFLT